MAEEAVEVEEQVEARKAEEARLYPPKPVDGEVKLTSAFIRQCIWHNEVGDGTLYATIHRDKLLYNNNSDQWYVWGGHYWKLDVMNRALALTSEIVDLYANEIKLINEELKEAVKSDKGADVLDYLKNLIKTARTSKNRMLKIAGRQTCLKAAVSIENPLAISGFELDINPWLLACQNGVINLETGDFGPGKPQDYITKAARVEWPAEGLKAKSELWRDFLADIFNDDQEKIKFVLKVLGYALTGLKWVRIFLVFYGEHGQNGKGVIFNLINYMLDDLAGPIPTEMLLKAKYGRNPSGPSPDILDLKGKRIVFASEPDEDQKFDIGKIKQFTGGEPLKARGPHDKRPTEFEPTHTIVLISNEEPGAKASDDAFWGRLRKIDFPNSYVEEPDPVNKPYQKKADQQLEGKLIKEASAVLVDLVRHCLLWQKEGLKVPDSVKADTEKWRRAEDPLADFIDACLVPADQNTRTKSADLHDIFTNWWLVNKGSDPKKVPGTKKFGTWMSLKYEKCKTDGGLAGYKGVEISPTLPDEYACRAGI